jgi:L-threonylcarbamoyladenylate synthase
LVSSSKKLLCICLFSEKMFEKNTIWAYPTDTSFGLGVRADDPSGLKKLYALKGRESGKFFSLMVRDLQMLEVFAEIPPDLGVDFFFQTPRTAVLKPKCPLPLSDFWPEDGVAFRVCTIESVAEHIVYPITATSANISGQPSFFSISQIEAQWGDRVSIFPGISQLPERSASEIWDLRTTDHRRIR